MLHNRFQRLTTRWYRLIPFYLVLTCGSCATTESEKRAYQIIHEPALHSEMQAMANSLGELAILYFDSDHDDARLYRSVQDELAKIERIASRLGGEDTITNYSVINNYMGAFLYDVKLAREFADRDPPNYVPAFRLLRSCQSCHESM